MTTPTIFADIEAVLQNNDVVLFMKGTPRMPQCGFSGFACQVLQKLGAAFEGVNVLESQDLRQGIKDFTKWPTIPQLYVKGEFVGGADIMRDMYESGELKTFLEEKGVVSQPAAQS